MRVRRLEAELAVPGGNSLQAVLRKKVIGQVVALDSIVPYVEMFQAGLAPEGRPAGVFLLLGPTGTGKTHTVEALAEALHGTPKNLLRVDCGEFQMEHEVAKLIGAPPGYLGHRETQPMLTQQKLNASTSERSSLSIVLFDEIEKAALSLTRLLLGVLDKGTLKLGDNSTVNFERSLVFMTSNLGASEMLRELTRGFGFGGMVPKTAASVTPQLEGIAMHAVKRRFSPEFMNRVDRSLTYHPLDGPSFTKILDLLLADLERHIFNRLGARGFMLEVTPEAKEFLLSQGTSLEYGARELRRTVLRHVMQPVSALVVRGEVEPAGGVRITARDDGQGLLLTPVRRRRGGQLDPAA